MTRVPSGPGRLRTGLTTGLLAMLALCGAADADKKEFLLGGDISMLTRIERAGAVFREAGKPDDPIRILKRHGCDCFRLRLFVNPNHVNAVVNDLAYTRTLAKRVKAAGMKLLLDLHYSDTWADPGKQTKPAAWKDLPFDALVKKVEDYTAAAIADLRKAGALPEIVQIGNEIAPGMLWPDGQVGGKFNTDKQWDQLAALLKAGIRGVRKGQGPGGRVRTMIHIHAGGSWARTKHFFDRIRARGVEFDMIGLSFYPWWHGRLEDLSDNLRHTIEAYGKDVVVVETAYPHRQAPRWENEKNMAWPISPAGQRAFLEAVIQTVRAAPGGRGKGVLWWYPESVPVEGLKIWFGGTAALFDAKGNALPAVRAFSEGRKTEGRR